jgi:hypothetical protein
MTVPETKRNNPLRGTPPDVIGIVGVAAGALLGAALMWLCGVLLFLL